MEKDQRKSEALVVSQEFNAPVAAVFAAFSDPEAMAEWWGPVGYTMTVTAFDFQRNGVCLFKMENDESLMWARFIYREIKEPELIAFVLSFSDENGGLTRAPFFDNWPLEILNVITLFEENGKTILTNTCSPVNASAEELASFNDNKTSLHGGFSAALQKLRKLLSVQR